MYIWTKVTLPEEILGRNVIFPIIQIKSFLLAEANKNNLGFAPLL